MDFQQWEAEVQRRIGINEGYSKTMYMDSANPPNPTIGVGFNLNRSDARQALSKIGADYDAVMNGTALTDQQVAKLFAYSFAPVLSEARASLEPTHFDSMSDARRFVICDLIFNLGNAGWQQFTHTRSLIDQACHAAHARNAAGAHTLFAEAADALSQSAWYSQVGNRAKRDVAMLRTSNWCNATGDGSDAS